MIIKKNYPFLLTTPATDIILHPLFHYSLYPTLTFDFIPPHIIPTRHYSFLSLGFAFTSLALAPVECLPPYLIPPPLLTLIVPFLVLSLSPLINYTRLSSPPISNTTDTDPSALLISLPIPLSNPTDTNSLSFFLSFSSLISFFFLYQDLSLALSSDPYAQPDCRLFPHGFAEQAACPLA